MGFLITFILLFNMKKDRILRIIGQIPLLNLIALSYIGFRTWWANFQKEEIMRVYYDLPTATILSYSWTSRIITPFSGEFSLEKWDLLKGFCSERTSISIWAGSEEKHLAYNEPIKAYLEDVSLLNTGQGFHHKSGKRYDGVQIMKCEVCGSQYIKTPPAPTEEDSEPI